MAAHPCVSRSTLFRAMKFALIYNPAAAAELARAGVGWDHVVQLLALRAADRPVAQAELMRAGMTSRQMRLWTADTFGPGVARGGRPALPIPGHRPAVQARALAADCRRLTRRHSVTRDVIGRAIDALAAGTPPSPAEAAQFRAALRATRVALRQVGPLYADLRRLTADAAA